MAAARSWQPLVHALPAKHIDQWQEIDISARPVSASKQSAGDALKNGELVIVLPEVVHEADCKVLVRECLAATETERQQDETPSMIRLVADTELPDGLSDVCGSIIKAVLARLDEQVPSVAAAHFKADARSLIDMHASKHDGFEFAWPKPAIIVYSCGGGDGYAQTPHIDGQALTMLVPLSTPGDDFLGGGTGFWPRDGSKGGNNIEEKAAPTILRPDAGTALVFGGHKALHAGVPIDSGSRVVFVASFSAAPPLTPDRIAQLKFRGLM